VVVPYQFVHDQHARQNRDVVFRRRTAKENSQCHANPNELDVVP
jgi:hypothetical protein